ncbi:MAG: hypothetical protein JO245_03640 [Pseudolabrys sp.]|nr:hypothetical protein [Pseudolabrys sp.]
MRRLQFLIAVAALTVTAISFGARDAVSYCRGCAMNAGAAAAAAAVAAPLAAEAAQIANPPGVDHVPEADVSANLPANVMNSAACHTERQPKIVNGKRTWDTVEVCE